MAKKKTLEQFIKEGALKHNGKYDYSRVVYKGNKTKVCIVCPKHGEFLQTPDRHLHSSGCLKCASEKRGLKRRMDFGEFKEKASTIHHGKYEYAESTFTKTDMKTKIICSTHGEFWQTPDSHLQGHGCPKCKAEKLAYLRKKESGDFIEKAKKIHGEKYVYTHVKYIDSTTPIKIICPIHGEFEQTPNSHLQGRGCVVCNNSHLEEKTKSILEELNIRYSLQQRFDWLINQKKLSLDFYLPQYNIAIECQGEQHVFNNKGFFNHNGLFEKRLALDKLKNSLCLKHNIPIIYIFNKVHSSHRLDEQFNHMYDDALFIEDIQENPQILLEKIKEHGKQ